MAQSPRGVLPGRPRFEVLASGLQPALQSSPGRRQAEERSFEMLALALQGLEQRVEALSSSVHEQRQEVERLTHRAQSSESSEGTSLEEQLRDLVIELRQLQQEQRQHTNPGQSSPQGEGSEGASELLEDLREERCVVAQMLDGVRQEKFEVVAMMHSFTIQKSEALQELEANE
ncbi:unnamed protein product [Polarella glacialis]|uniref:Uncharacterized protein n=1 Tax=Polarella glacialis TaxID=89957 RepID=A0A813LGI6_POLGL|nr:unnamed protein product [Polarella glacialis]